MLYKSSILFFLLVLLSAGYLSAQEQDGTSQGGNPPPPMDRPLQVGSSNNFPPINFLDNRGDLTGFGRDISQAVANVLGREINHLHSSRWMEVLEWMSKGEIDFIHDMGINEERKEHYDFTDPIISMDEVIFVRANQFDIDSFKSLENRKVICVTGHVSHIFLIQFPLIECVPADTPMLGLFSLISGEADAMVYPRQVILFLSQRAGVANRLKVIKSQELRTLEWGMAVPKGHTALLEELNRGIRVIKRNGTYQEIYEHYFGQPLFSEYSNREITYILAGVTAISLLGGGTVVLLFMVWRLRNTRNRLLENISSRRRAESALRDTEGLYSTIANNSREGIWVADGEDRIRFLNQRMAEILGVSLEQAIGMEILSFWDEQNQEMARRALKRRKMGISELYDMNFRRKDGTIVWLLVSGTPIFDSRGAYKGQVGIHTDITERKRMEARLLSSERKFRNLVEGSIQGLMIIQDNRVAFANQATADIYGYESPDEMMALDSAEILISSKDRGKVVGMGEQIIKNEGTPTMIEFLARRKDGTEVWLESVNRGVEWMDAPAIQATFNDITARKTNEKALVESEQRYRFLVENSLQGILIERNGTPLFANQALAEMFGYNSAADVLQLESTRILICPEHRDEVSRHEHLRQKGGDAPLRYEYKGVKKDGSEVWVEALTRWVVWDDDLAVQSVKNDITGRKKAEEKLTEVYKEHEQMQFQLLETGKLAAIGELAAGIAHEINNPLAIIASSAEILQEGLEQTVCGGESGEGASLFKRHLEKINSTIFRCKSVIQTLMEFAHKERDIFTTVDLRHLLEETITLIKNSAQSRERTITLALDAGPRLFAGENGSDGHKKQVPGQTAGRYAMRASPQQLQQVFLNLLLNAIQATAPGGEIRVALSHGNGGVQAVFEDNGTGISPESLERIFDPFFTTRSSQGGTGMGLSLVRQIIQTLKGTIGVESEVGKGTAVSIWLPTDFESLKNQLDI